MQHYRCCTTVRQLWTKVRLFRVKVTSSFSRIFFTKSTISGQISLPGTFFGSQFPLLGFNGRWKSYANMVKLAWKYLNSIYSNRTMVSHKKSARLYSTSTSQELKQLCVGNSWQRSHTGVRARITSVLSIDLGGHACEVKGPLIF